MQIASRSQLRPYIDLLTSDEQIRIMAIHRHVAVCQPRLEAWVELIHPVDRGVPDSSIAIQPRRFQFSLREQITLPDRAVRNAEEGAAADGVVDGDEVVLG